MCLSVDACIYALQGPCKELLGGDGEGLGRIWHTTSEHRRRCIEGLHLSKFCSLFVVFVLAFWVFHISCDLSMFASAIVRTASRAQTFASSKHQPSLCRYERAWHITCTNSSLLMCSRYLAPETLMTCLPFGIASFNAAEWPLLYYMDQYCFACMW